MVQYRKGLINSTTALISSGISIKLGFIPDKFTILNYTKTVAGSGVGYSEWINGVVPTDKALISTYTAGAPVVTLLASAGISPVTLGADWQNTIYTITGISSANPAVVTLSSLTPTNGMTLVNGMTVTISGVNGVTGLNTNRYIVTSVGVDAATAFRLYDLFGNPVDTTTLGTYTSGGQLDLISYPPTAPVLDAVTGQVLTPSYPAGLQYDMGWEGVSLASGVLGSNGDVLWWEAITETPTGW